MDQYVHDNTEDEFTHFTFINSYLKSRGAQAGEPRSVPDVARKRRHRVGEGQATDEPDGADRRHDLVDALPRAD